MIHDSNLMPSVSAVCSDLQGGYTSNVFEQVEAVVRSLGAHRFINLTRSTSQPSAPDLYDYWVKPATIEGGTLKPSNLSVWDGSNFVTNSPTIFAKAIIHHSQLSVEVNATHPIIGNGQSDDKIRLDVSGLTEDSVLVYNHATKNISWQPANASGGVVLV